ncbi:NAD(P)-dependent oxidoreductase [Nisaea sediminum]|uniref:NAD(P)-dependent oxidoreductase n=1 Tax=Nisaea sediminum TaxID=2775867 RepID=UPI001865C623|nr:NAD(P)-dependent oxidoreductase [Nisaea sediminum]
MAEKIGLVGLGNAGLAVATALLRHGPVAGFDRSPERRQLAAKEGVEVVEQLSGLSTPTPSQIVLSLPKPEASLEVVEAICSWTDKPSLIVETSTVTPDTAKRCAALCADAGIAFVDAAIAGGVASMAAGEITFFLGGSEESKASARPLLQSIAAQIFDLGPVGAGMGTKVVNNGVMHAVMVVLIEAFAMARKLDVPSETLVQILNREEGLLRPLVHRVGERMRDGNYQSGMSVTNARKDSVLALETAQQLGVPLFATLASHTPYEIAEAKGMGSQDYAALAKLWEDWCSIHFNR